MAGCFILIHDEKRQRAWLGNFFVDYLDVRILLCFLGYLLISVGLTACHVCNIERLYWCNSLSIRSGNMHATCVLERVSTALAPILVKVRTMQRVSSNGNHTLTHESVYFGCARTT